MRLPRVASQRVARRRWDHPTDRLQKLARRFMGVAGRRRMSVASLGWRETPKLGNWGLTPLQYRDYRYRYSVFSTFALSEVRA